MKNEAGQAPEVMASLAKVSREMNELTQAFANVLETLEREGGDPEKIRRLTQGIQALQDSSSIYLSWAGYYATFTEMDGQEEQQPPGENVLEE